LTAGKKWRFSSPEDYSVDDPVCQDTGVQRQTHTTVLHCMVIAVSMNFTTSCHRMHLLVFRFVNREYLWACPSRPGLPKLLEVCHICSPKNCRFPSAKIALDIVTHRFKDQV
jgi:hypothetical protein